MRLRRVLAVGGVGALSVLASAGTALATHTHVKVVGDGQCVVLAEKGGEEDVNLPSAVFAHNPNVQISPAAGRNHPLHVLVHKGVPGGSDDYFVLGSSDASAACAAGYVNR